jgi:Skp family chaperone for outer membrane proteins
MKKKIFTLILILTSFMTPNVFSEANIVYLDMKFIMNNSLAGKSIISQLNETQKKLSTEYIEKEKKLKSEEVKLVSQKNILVEEEYLKKVKILREKIQKHNKEKSISSTELNKKRIVAQTKLATAVTEIIANYAKQNSSKLIFKKESIIIGETSLDITEEIVKTLNDKYKKIKI